MKKLLIIAGVSFIICMVAAFKGKEPEVSPTPITIARSGDCTLYRIYDSGEFVYWSVCTQTYQSSSVSN